MFKLIKRKPLLAFAGVLVVLAGAGAAFAYFTSTGSGTATATVGSSSALTVNGTPAGSVYPGASTTVNFTASNPSGGHEYLSTIHLASLTVDSGHSAAGCSASWFSMADIAANQDIPPGTGAGATAVTATGSLAMSNSGNQDPCQGATLTLNFTTT